MEQHYDHESWINTDIDRHNLAVKVARQEKVITTHTELHCGASEDGSVKAAFKILTRSPKTEDNQCWNLPDKDRCVLGWLAKTGWQVIISLHDSDGLLAQEIPLEAYLENATRIDSGNGHTPYWRLFCEDR